jgi:hypothetical protein
MRTATQSNEEQRWSTVEIFSQQLQSLGRPLVPAYFRTTFIKINCSRAGRQSGSRTRYDPYNNPTDNRASSAHDSWPTHETDLFLSYLSDPFWIPSILNSLIQRVVNLLSSWRCDEVAWKEWTSACSSGSSCDRPQTWSRLTQTPSGLWRSELCSLSFFTG